MAVNRPEPGEGFGHLLERLDADPGRAAQRFHALRARLVRLFAWRECTFPDDLADLTLERVARKLAQGTVVHPPDPWAYVAGIAHNVFRETLRREGRERAALRARAAEPAPSPPAEDERLPCLERCLAALPSAARELVLAYHNGRGAARTAARASLAEELGLSAGALRIKVHRLKESIEACVLTCVGTVTPRARASYQKDSGEGGPG